MKQFAAWTMLFIVAFSVSVLMMMPLSWAFDKAGLGQAGLRWERMQGSIFKGKAFGLSYGNQPIGDVDLRASLNSLSRKAIAYDVKLDGPGVTAEGLVAFNSKLVSLDGFAAMISVQGLVDVVPEIRETDAKVNLQDVNIGFRDNICVTASGTISSDLLTKIVEMQVGLNAGELAGSLVCDEEKLLLTMEGAFELSDRVTVNMRLGWQELSDVEIRVHTTTEIVAEQLLNIGFLSEAGTYVFREQVDFFR